ncbi:hypothetical protein DL768_000726 [Monosporascus sp. mg162]|nr:hypothetical protein DL768_000726 [Monosporascus sp. mg162]
MGLADPVVTLLGPDPSHRNCVLNGNAFQQDAIQSFNGWQYACFYSPLPGGGAAEPLFVHVARRRLPHGPWETLVLDDYPQTTDDGHNTVQVGHRVRYRFSLPKVALSPEGFEWEPKLFRCTLSQLPGLEGEDELFGYITYPRFGQLGEDLWFSWRTGKAGLGDDHLSVYRAGTGRHELVGGSGSGTHLRGVDGNPYIHGLHHRDGRLHATWVWRGFVWYEGWDDPADTKHKAQAGPNSAQNNHDICYAYSDDGGRTWCNGAGERVADLSRGESIRPDSPGIVAFEIPRGSGLHNQESQAVDHSGGVHVLNRDNLDGEQRWKHYYRSSDGSSPLLAHPLIGPSGFVVIPSEGTWTQRALPHVKGLYGGKRGQVVVSRDDDLYFVLPDTEAPTLTILKALKDDGYSTYELVWRKEGFPPTDPLVDETRLDYDNVLSVYTRAVAEGVDVGAKSNNVVILDFQL